MPSATCVNCKKPFCGDGIVQNTTGEVCDEGEAMPSATCRADCTKPICGDGIFDAATEQCKF